MRTRSHLVRIATRLALFVVLATLPCLGSCGGVGSVVVGDYAQLLIGPHGGHAEGGFVTLDIPPGALDHDEIVRILPQPDPLPIVSPPGIPLVYHGGIMCVGPIGMIPLVPCHVRACYDVGLLPPDVLETDLVLLEWDDVSQVMRVSPTAVQDLVNHCFVDDVYDEFGHIAVGRPDGVPQFSYYQLPPVAPASVAPQGQVAFGLAIAKPGGPPTVIPGTDDAFSFLPSTDGSRLVYDTSAGKGGTVVRTVDVADAWSRTVSANGAFVVGGDSLYGWFPDQDRCFYDYVPFTAGGASVPEYYSPGFTDGLAAVGGSGTPPAADFAFAGFATGLVDLRFSPDGSMLLLRWRHDDFKTFFERFDVVDAITGASIGTDLPVSFSRFGTMPRWLPDSSGLYYPGEDSDTVWRIDPDGGNAQQVSTLPDADGSLVDLVIAPDQALVGTANAHCAFFRRVFPGNAPAFDVFCVDFLALGDRHETALATTYFVSELIYHPDGATVWADLFTGEKLDGPPSDVTPTLSQEIPISFGDVTVVFDSSTAAIVRTFDLPISEIDVALGSGFVLVHVPESSSELDLPSSGLYVAEPDGLNPVHQDLLSPGSPGRWLHSWRHVPGFQRAFVR
jgi:hypothetical protein